ncbi:TPA: flippase, partial [Candidatus Poribacteria bacterium]|nr:flippase [Candidatus Poribacteria bacterium]
TFGGIAIYVHLMGYPPKTIQIAYILGASELINSLSQLFRCVFRAYERMIYESATVAVDRIIVLTIGLLIVSKGYDIETFCWVVTGSSLFILLVTIIIAETLFVRVKLGFSADVWRRITEWSLPFALANIFSMIYFKLGILMLSKLSGDEAVSWYGVGYTIVMALLVLPGAFSGAIYPEISKMLAAKDSTRARLAYQTSLKLMLVAGLPMAMTLSFSSREFVLLFYDPSRFPPGTIDASLRVLAWSGFLSFLNFIMTAFYRAADKRKAFTFLTGSTTALNLILNAVMIPRLDHVGAALAMAFSELFFLLASFIYMSRSLGLRINWGSFGKPILCCLILAGFLYLGRGWNRVLLSLIGGSGYLALLILIKGVTMDDLRSLQT